MNSLEFIEFYIKEYKRSVEWYKKYQEKNPTSFVNTLKEEELILHHLFQIKNILEAWEVMKKHLTITLNGGIKEIIVTGIDYEGQKNSLFIYSKEGVPVIEKALEVENEKN